MRLLIDSAVPDDWAWARERGLARAATSNPSLIHAAGRPVTLATCRQLVQEANQVGLDELHLQAWPDDHSDWHPVAQELAALDPKVVVKLPAVDGAFQAARTLTAQGSRVLLTAISNTAQGVAAAGLGAHYVAPYIGRLLEGGADVWALVDALVVLQRQHGPQILAASVRDLPMLTELVIRGAAHATLRRGLLESWLNDPQTAAAVAQFEADRHGSLAR